ncbi:MAG: carbohydrate binding family 9 domain-containing protein, partial [Candidatus Aminicenantes bacterium]|nr:carbohydrate binding family 9 domain-containing protein [Candidatus Aminicenantes bacterium]
MCPLAAVQEKLSPPDSRDQAIVVQRLNGPVTLDGLSTEPAWQKIPSLPMVMQSPNFGGSPSEKTEVLLGFDDEYLYIAGRLYDKEPDKIQSPSKKRDYMGANTDWFGVIFDTFNDKENGLGFFTTPSGLRWDGAVFNDGVARLPNEMPINLSWNTFWDVETVQNNEGWFVEMRIPFSSLRFQDREGSVTMGLLVWRWIPR